MRFLRGKDHRGVCLGVGFYKQAGVILDEFNVKWAVLFFIGTYCFGFGQ